MKDSSFMDVTLPRILSTFAVLMFVILWIGFVIVLLKNRTWLDLLWDWVQMLPILLQIIVWLVFLPVMVGLWIWKSSWSTFVTLLALTGMLIWTYSAVSAFMKAWFVQAG